MDRGAWQATVHGVAQSRTNTHTHTRLPKPSYIIHTPKLL